MRKILTLFVLTLNLIAVLQSSEVVFKNDDESPKRAEISSRGPEANQTEERSFKDGASQGKNLLSWLHSFESDQTDPYLAKSNAACLQGDLAECFKAKALDSLEEFFTKNVYVLNTNAKVIRLPEEELRSLRNEPYEYEDSVPRTEEPEWDQFVKFLTRKVERFLKSTAVEVKFSDDVTENGRYSPRFVDEISSELDAIEDKKASSFSKVKAKKLLIPLLILLKLFKLKLLLFLPLILGLASFKKFLGFLAIAIPGMIGFFKLCKPDMHHNYGSFGHSTFYHRPPHQYVHTGGSPFDYRNPDIASAGGIYSPAASEESYQFQLQQQHSSQPSTGVAFREDPHKLAYSAYDHDK